MMKRILYIMCAVLTAALASCNYEETEDDDSATRLVTIEAIADWEMADGSVDSRTMNQTSVTPQTRIAPLADRYRIEVYEQADYTVAAPVFADGTSKATNATGSFNMALENGKSYYCLLWADNKLNGAAVYNTGDLKNVSLMGGSTPSEAFHGTLTIDGKSTSYRVSLHRAVANIVLKETGTLPVGTLTMKFNQPTAFDVSEATSKGIATERTETLTLAEEINGTNDSPATINRMQRVFILAPVVSAAEMTFTFQYGSEEEIEVSEVAVQANYRTNIKGHYTKN